MENGQAAKADSTELNYAQYKKDVLTDKTLFVNRVDKLSSQHILEKQIAQLTYEDYRILLKEFDRHPYPEVYDYFFDSDETTDEPVDSTWTDVETLFSGWVWTKYDRLPQRQANNRTRSAIKKIIKQTFLNEGKLIKVNYLVLSFKEDGNAYKGYYFNLSGEIMGVFFLDSPGY